jgi:hypothetical protein
MSALNRQCGECTACCRLLPVAELGKDAGQRCRHQRHRKGCAVYAARPTGCKGWSCLWLTDPATARLRRPDRSGYVLDCMRDFTRARNEVTSVETVFEVVQIWASDRGATLEAELIPYLEVRHAGAAIRSETEGVVVLVPPSASQHTVEEVERALAPRPSLSERG